MRYVAASNRWESLSLGCSGPFSCFAANDKYMVFPCYEPTGWHSGMTEFGGLFVYDIGMRRCRRLAVPDGLPNVDFRSVAVENDKAWVGGKGFIAVVDLPSARVEKLCKLRSVFRVRCLELVGNEVWFSSGPGLYRLAKDAR
jgi:hypothetical protein